jgi:WD40 repeat protein
LVILNVADGSERHRLPDGSVEQVALSPDGHTLAHTDYQTVKVRDLKSGKDLSTFACSEDWPSTGDALPLGNPMRLLADNKTLFFGLKDGRAWLWNLEANRRSPSRGRGTLSRTRRWSRARTARPCS